MRVGISVGDVTFEPDDCFGLPVIEAQRLEAAAEGGQILCAEIVRHLARGRGGHEFPSVGDLDLKGIPDPGAGGRRALGAGRPGRDAAGNAAAAGARRRPPPSTSPAAADELAVLVDAWKERAEGRSHVRADLRGARHRQDPPRRPRPRSSHGKSGGLVLAGRCDEELGLPYQPFVEALRFQLSLGEDVPAEWFGPLASELARLVPELADRVAGSECSRAERPGVGARPSVRGGDGLAAHDRRVGPGDARARRPPLGRPADVAAAAPSAARDHARLAADRRHLPLHRSRPHAIPSRRCSPTCAAIRTSPGSHVDGLTDGRRRRAAWNVRRATTSTRPASRSPTRCSTRRPATRSSSARSCSTSSRAARWSGATAVGRVTSRSPTSVCRKECGRSSVAASRGSTTTAQRTLSTAAVIGLRVRAPGARGGRRQRRGRGRSTISTPRARPAW